MIGEGLYNVDDMKELKVTESFLGLNEEVRDCQDKEAIQNCTTKLYLAALLQIIVFAGGAAGGEQGGEEVIIVE